MEFHRAGADRKHHQIGSADLARMLKVHLDKALENYCLPMDCRVEEPGSSSWAVPVKLILMPY
jgi:hypothetical protein